jgi:CelD/BcsL family acetyltransferase involved in cellulose biosynthesis
VICAKATTPPMSVPLGADRTAYDVTVARTVDEVEGLRDTWEGMKWPRADADIDFYLEILRARQEVIRPHVMVLERNSEAEAMFVGRVEEIPLVSKIGYKVLLKPTVRSITLVHGGAVGVDGDSAAEALVAALLECLAEREADVVSLPALRTDSSLFRSATSSAPYLCRQHFFDRRTHRRLELPESMDEFLRSRSRTTREGIKRGQKRLLKDFEGRVSTRAFDDESSIDQLFADVARVAGKTYQHELGVAFTDTDEYRRLTRLAMERRWFRAYILYLAETPAAFWHGLAYDRTFFIGTPGYDPAYKHYGLGTFSLMTVIEDLCGDDAVEAIDFGFGDAEYKRRFGNEAWEEADVVLFAPTARAVMINVSRTSVLAAAWVARNALERTGLLRRVKQRWRARIASRDHARE